MKDSFSRSEVFDILTEIEEDLVKLFRGYGIDDRVPDAIKTIESYFDNYELTG